MEEIDQLAERVAPGSRLLRAWPLEGGVSAQVMAFEIERPGGITSKLVLRRHGERDRARNPQIAADEYRLLQILQWAGVPAPKPVHFDQTGLVVEFIEGGTDLAPTDLDHCLVQMARQLARIHAIDDTAADLSFLPRKLCHTGAQPIRTALLHGDFWPGNILWRAGRLVAVIDWEDAAIGDPLADLGNARLEIAWAFGIDAMCRFTDQYRSQTAIDLANLPSWDLYAAHVAADSMACWRLDAATERTMRKQLDRFIRDARAQCSGADG